MSNFHYLEYNLKQFSYRTSIECLLGNYQFNSPNAISRINKFEKIEKILLPDGIVLPKHLKLYEYDLLRLWQFNYPFFVMSERMISLLQTLRLPKYQLFPLNIYQKNKQYPYQLFYSYETFYQFFDFPKCEIFVVHSSNQTITKTPIAIHSLKEFEYIYQQFAELKCKFSFKKVAILKETPYDLFRLSSKHGGKVKYIASGGFKEAIINAKLKGFRFASLAPLEKYEPNSDIMKKLNRMYEEDPNIIAQIKRLDE